jgi:RHS repeat-associated protein
VTTGSDVTPFGIQGSYTDATRLIYLINRYYDPSTDQFLSIDPLLRVTDQPYLFTGDNPLNRTDPLGLGPQADAALLGALKALLARETALKKNATKANLAAVNVLSSRVLTDESVVNSDNEQAMRVATGTGTTEVPSQVASAQSEQSAASVCEAQASDIIKDGSFAGSITSLGAGGISGGRTLLKMLLDGPGEEAAADTAPETEGWSTLFYGAAILVVSLVGGISRAATC